MADPNFIYDGSLRYSENGTCVLMPSVMPHPRNADGEDETQGRYAVAFSRNGWYVLDEAEFKIVRWCASEADAIAGLNAIASRPTCTEECDDDLWDCEGHPAGPGDPMGQTVYCDGSCNLGGPANLDDEVAAMREP